MFLEKTWERNYPLIEAAVSFHKSGVLWPDTYLIDVDTLRQNASRIRETADHNGLHLYFMLKQLGRNPAIAQELMRLGYDGAVVVDFREAETMIDSGIPIGNVGHLVQIPKAALKKILSAKPDYVTVYSLEKACEIDAVCAELSLEQKLMLRVLGETDLLYSGQYGGFPLSGLEGAAREFKKLGHIRVAGLTSFPCFLFDENSGKVEPTPNIGTLQKAKELLTAMGFSIDQMNMPSATCCASLPLIRQAGGTHGEPGHGLTGTTPLHAVSNCEEIPAIVYLSEVSHLCGDTSYCYGGGHYRRSHVKQALVGSPEEHRFLDVIPPTDESIDYHFGLNGPVRISESVVMAFRTQIFVTRSHVALIGGISEGKPQVLGIYTSEGMRIQ
ncbi:putative protein YhfX [Caprobacter fermentans]|uniref:YhfX family PLP-dependent enzyme n=1 Tax=Caproicibacter fermentans TaxID=2576756 RepID=A0A6N8I1X3_9FIRM|nr:YhfX family PLP-dependent enzyme [Caproicibacter fermentans]MVB12032.1 putative protein YhfX [Caproicibacter fermentans]OCN03032.1 amino-acid racemase [Clostridium sp. W14A]QNK40630.1 YhfX family PLP-dependent enzyme [Caproicibacter fermentans]